MPTESAIRQSFRTGISSNTDPVAVKSLRQMRRSWREGADLTSDLTDSFAYIATAAGSITQPLWQAATYEIVNALSTLPFTAGGGENVRAFRNRLRALLVDPASPLWLKASCEHLKRTKLCDEDSSTPPKRVYDQQPTDPINALADAALAVIAAASSTPVQIAEAAAVVDRWKAMTPEQPQ